MMTYKGENPRNDKKNLMRKADIYLEKGKVYDAIQIFQSVGKKRKVKRLNRYLERTGGSEKAASEIYLKKKNRIKNSLVMGMVSVPIIGTIIGSFVPYEVIKEKEVTKYRLEDSNCLDGENLFLGPIKTGETLWDVIERRDDLFYFDIMKGKIGESVNSIVRINLDKYPYLRIDNISVVNGKVVVNKSDGVMGDVLKGGEELWSGYVRFFTNRRKKVKVPYKDKLRTQERGKWPNKNGAAAGVAIGALAASAGLLRRRKRRR